MKLHFVQLIQWRHRWLGLVLFGFISIWVLQSFPHFWIALVSSLIFICYGIVLILGYRRTPEEEKCHASLIEKDNKLEKISKKLKKLTQQLIIQDKVASVGLLTAGIAHEIKNPLNFVNNFAESNIDLINEIKTKIESLPADVKERLNEIENNCKKINSHGKRAESIIRNMLVQVHSKDGKNNFLVNELIDEYVNLAYHGMRARNNKFNITIEKKLDPTLKEVHASMQGIGRVFLNLLNNSLYATNERAEKGNVPNYQPQLVVSTEQDDNYVIIKIWDNGTGIPPKIKSKIFEPFFTTKPVGQGTGLGLPICYDIIVNEHHGKLEVNSKPDEFTEFVIKLPKNK